MITSRSHLTLLALIGLTIPSAAMALEGDAVFRSELNAPIFFGSSPSTPPLEPDTAETHSCMVPDGSGGWHSADIPVTDACPEVPTQACADYDATGWRTGFTNVPVFEVCAARPPATTVRAYYQDWGDLALLMMAAHGVNVETPLSSVAAVHEPGYNPSYAFTISGAALHIQNRTQSPTLPPNIKIIRSGTQNAAQCRSYLASINSDYYTTMSVQFRLANGSTTSLGAGTKASTPAAITAQHDALCNRVGTAFSGSTISSVIGQSYSY